VFAKKLIPKNCRFGPVEGRIVTPPPSPDPLNPLKFRLMIRSDDGHIRIVDVSDENASNWMKFVRSAEKAEEQNTILSQVSIP
jgi:PR domain zinc finger protein 10